MEEEHNPAAFLLVGLINAPKAGRSSGLG